MAIFRAEKVVSSLPSQLTPDTLYAVRTGVGFDLYVSDATGSVAHQINYPAPSGGGGETVALGRWEVTSAASLAADNVFDDSLYSYYTIVGQLRPATSGVSLNARMRDATPADVVTTILAGNFRSSMDAPDTGGSTSLYIQENVSSANGVKSFVMELFMPGISSPHSFHWRASVYSSDFWYSYIAHGLIGDGTPRQGIRFFFSSGNIATGWMEIVGHKKQTP